MNKIKAFFTNKDNRPKVIGIIVTAAVLFLGALIAVVVSINANQEQRTSISGAIDMFTTIDEVPPASVMIAPASNTWWNNLLQYSSDRNLDNVNYDSISAGAENIAYSVSKGSEYKSVSALGVSTTYIIYDTVANVEKAAKVMDAANIQYYVHENVLIFIPEGAFSDIDYTLSSLKDKETNLIRPMNIREAQWTINFGNFEELYTANFANPKDVLTFEDFVKSLGLSNTSTWEGTSKDGLTWVGKFNNVNVNAIGTPDEVISALTAPDAAQKEKMQELIDAGPEPVDGGEYSLPLAPKIQRMLPSCCFNISDNETSVGAYFLNGEQVQPVVLDEKDGILRITFLINDVVALLSGNTASYPVSNFGLMTITVLDTSGNSEITFTKIPSVENNSNVEETTENVE
jgi:hypothetical protein